MADRRLTPVRRRDRSARLGRRGRSALAGLVLALPAIATSGGDLAAQAALTSSRIARLDSAVAAVLEERDAVGLQVAVGVGDRVGWLGWAGMANLEDDVPVTADTRFRTGSIAEWMTATAAMSLAERGELDLDAPVQRYCSSLPESAGPLTARRLLARPSGARRDGAASDEPGDEPGDAPARRAKTTGGPPGHALLGCVLRGAAGAPYERLMDELVFRPAGMVHTRRDDDPAAIPNRARGYVLRGGRIERSRDPSEEIEAGGPVSTAADLVRFALAWGRGTLIGEESVRRMTAPPADDPDAERYDGLGVEVHRTPERTILRNTGGRNGARTILVLVPELDLAIAALTNYESIEDGLAELADRALEIVAAP